MVLTGITYAGEVKVTGTGQACSRWSTVANSVSLGDEQVSLYDLYNDYVVLTGVTYAGEVKVTGTGQACSRWSTVANSVSLGDEQVSLYDLYKD